MILLHHSFIVVFLVNSIFASFDNSTWVDYDTIINNYDDEDLKGSSRSALIIANNRHYSNYINEINRISNFELSSNKTLRHYYDRIVGGTRANIENYRYQVSIAERGFGHICGGSLITHRWVISAAHCFFGSNTPTTGYYIRAGSSFRTRGGVISFPSRIYVARKFKPSTLDYDIALLRLRNGYSRQDFANFPIRRIRIRKALPRVGTELTVTGWGTIRAGNTRIPDHLRKAKIPLVNHNYCNRNTALAGQISIRMFCAGFIQGGKDACQGDSGGPIVAHKTLVGIVSWGDGCAERNSPGVYTNVAKFLPYIRKLVRNR